MKLHPFTRCALVVVLALTACGSGAPDPADKAPAAFVPPVTAAPEAVAGLRNTTPLTAHVGRYPRDAVDGVSFFDRTEVAGALAETVADGTLRQLIIGREATTTPIFRAGGRVAAHGCTAHDCTDHNWTVLIPADGRREAAAVCHHDAERMGDASDWMTRGGTERRPGACPQG